MKFTQRITTASTMRILHMNSEKGWRGGEQQLAYLLDGLAAMDVQNILVVKKGTPLEKFSTERKIPCYAIRYSHSMDLVSAFKVRQICRKERVDIIHLHSSKAHGVAVLSALLGNRTPMVLSRRVAFLPGTNILSKWKYNHRQIRKILCVSRRIMDIMKSYLRDGSRCITVYSGIDLDKFRNVKPDKPFIINEFKLDPNATIIAAIGAIDEAKDHLTFVNTMENLVKSGQAVQGLIIGDGPLRKELNQVVRQKGLEEHVIFAGYRKDVPRILASVDVFLMTSKEEGLGTSLLDAFLARIPVVATDTGGIPEIVRDGQTGLLAPVQDAGKLSENIRRLIADPSLRQQLVETACRFVKAFSKEVTSAETYRVYQEVLSTSE